MYNAIWFISYKLKKNVSEENFLLASEKCHQEVLSQQKDFISWDVLHNGETWVDLIKWETEEDAKKAETAGANNLGTQAFYSFINTNTCTIKFYSVEKSH